MTMFFKIISHAVNTSRQSQPFQKSFLGLDGHFKFNKKSNFFELKYVHKIKIISLRD